MKNKLLITLFSFGLLLGCKTQITQTESSKITTINTNIPVREHSIQAILWQQQSAEYRALTYQAFNLARLQLDNILNANNEYDKPIAIVTDIDETILDNSPYSGKQVELDEEYTSSRWKEWVTLKNAKAIPGAVDFFQYAKSKGVEVFYISNRKALQKKETIENLVQVGFPFADQSHVLLKDVTSGKLDKRLEVMKSHNIVMLLGDNLSDFSMVFEKSTTENRNRNADSLRLDFGKKFIVLPNPLYGDWETNGVYEGNYKWSTFQKDSIRRKKITSY